MMSMSQGRTFAEAALSLLLLVLMRAVVVSPGKVFLSFCLFRKTLCREIWCSKNRECSDVLDTYQKLQSCIKSCLYLAHHKTPGLCQDQNGQPLPVRPHSSNCLVPFYSTSNGLVLNNA